MKKIMIVEDDKVIAKELYNLLVKNNFENLGNYYFEMGYLTCNKTIKPKEVDGYIQLATPEDEGLLSEFIYNESREITDIKDLSMDEAKDRFKDRLKLGTYYVWKNSKDNIVAQAFYKVLDNNAKISGVYTLPEKRGKGYAANIIYVLTNKMLQEGKHVSLYTDYSYIPSNKAYKNVGYKEEDILINFSCTKIDK